MNGRDVEACTDFVLSQIFYQFGMSGYVVGNAVTRTNAEHFTASQSTTPTTPAQLDQLDFISPARSSRTVP
jgi:hypothetical protein